MGQKLVEVSVLAGAAAAMLFDTGVNGTTAEAVLAAPADPWIILGAIVTAVMSNFDLDRFVGVADACLTF